MFMVFEAKGFQWIARPGEKLKMPRINKEVGDIVNFNKVLLVKNDKVEVGHPYIEGASVAGKILGHCRDKKIVVFKYKRRKRYRKKKGHLQTYTEVEIKDLIMGTKKKKIKKSIKKPPKIELEEIQGIGKMRAEKLRKSGIKDLNSFLKTDDEKLKAILGNLQISKMKKEGASLIKKRKGVKNGS
ncbi:MAG: 50S ribosomal protein L21 [candidate division WOR-3 bacterium]|nr:50S ribosomal protein L21 [candidate division WOR-3 bacterium]